MTLCDLVKATKGIETTESTLEITPETLEDKSFVNFLFVKRKEKNITKNRKVINP